MQKALITSVANIFTQHRDTKKQLKKQFDKREAQEERLIELATTGARPMKKIRKRIEKTPIQRGAIEEKIEFIIDRLQYTSDVFLSFL